MQLDKTYIAIRERDMLDIMDLSLQVIRKFLKPLTILLLLGVTPILLLQHWLLGGFDLLAIDEDTLFYEMGWRLKTIFKVCMFAVFFSPLASAPATLYLGQALFSAKPNPRRVFGDWLRSLPQLILLQSLIRSLLLSGIYICLFELSFPAQVMLYILTFFTCLLPFGVWPYLNEIILLERNPLLSKGGNRTTTMKRSRALHRSSFGELLIRWIGASVYAAILVLLLFSAMWLTKAWLSGNFEISRLTYLMFLETATWLTACYFMVVRFLCYLDLRIRREGWEVELKMRAEGARLARQLI